VYRAAVVTVSDRASRGERPDESGRTAGEMLAGIATVEEYRVIPDDMEQIIETLVDLSDRKRVHLVITTGGTGFGPRDNTPEATLAVVEREAPGLAEAMRVEGLKETPRAMLSRGVAGIRQNTLIINLPGSPKAVRAGLGVLLPVLPHALEVLVGRAGECGRE
jgi:molybdenum cofactor synthesis domain-containing protein